MSWLDRRERRLRLRRFAAVPALAVLGACLFAASASAATVNVTLSNPGISPEFTPQVINVHPGDSINWVPTSGFTGGTIGFVDVNCNAAPGPGGITGTGLPGANGGGGFPIATNAAPGTYYFADPTRGGCSPGFAAPLLPNVGEIVVQNATASPTNNATLTSTVAVNPQFTSVTLSTNSAAFGSCSGGSSTSTALGFPNGNCTTPSFTVKNNGTVSEGIDVQVGGTAAPADAGTGGTPWTLLGTQGTPGQDQFQLFNNLGTLLTPTATPDSNATAGLAPGVQFGSTLRLVGPTKSTDPSSSFSTTATWTAISQ